MKDGGSSEQQAREVLEKLCKKLGMRVVRNSSGAMRLDAGWSLGEDDGDGCGKRRRRCNGQWHEVCLEDGHSLEHLDFKSLLESFLRTKVLCVESGPYREKEVMNPFCKMSIEEVAIAIDLGCIDVQKLGMPIAYRLHDPT